MKETEEDVLKDQTLGFSCKSLETISKNEVQGMCELLKKFKIKLFLVIREQKEKN